MIYIGSACGVGVVTFVVAVVIDDAGFAVGACAGGVGVDGGPGDGDILAIASLPLLLGRGGGTGLLLPLNLPGFGAELLPYTYMVKKRRAYTRIPTHKHTRTRAHTHIHA